MRTLLRGFAAALLGGLLILAVSTIHNAVVDSDPLSEYERVTLEKDWASTPADSKRDVCKTKTFCVAVLLLAIDGDVSSDAAIRFWEEKCE